MLTLESAAEFCNAINAQWLYVVRLCAGLVPTGRFGGGYWVSRLTAAEAEMVARGEGDVDAMLRDNAILNASLARALEMYGDWDTHTFVVAPMSRRTGTMVTKIQAIPGLIPYLLDQSKKRALGHWRANKGPMARDPNPMHIRIPHA